MGNKKASIVSTVAAIQSMPQQTSWPTVAHTIHMKLIALDKMLRLSAKNINPNSHDLILANKMNPDKTSMIKFSLNLCRCNFRITLWVNHETFCSGTWPFC